MDTLYGTLGASEVKELLVEGGKPVAVSIEPGNGAIPAGALIYRKSSGLYAPAAAGQISTSYNLLVLQNAVDTTTDAGVAVAAAAYEKGVFKAGKVLKENSGDYEAISADEALVLRLFGITLSPFDDWGADDVEVDNRLAHSVTVTPGSGGTATADKATAKIGDVVTLTITPEAGKVIDAITVTAGGVTVGDDKKFVMGDKNVAISVTFKAE